MAGEARFLVVFFEVLFFAVLCLREEADFLDAAFFVAFFVARDFPAFFLVAIVFLPGIKVHMKQRSLNF
jgi:hypothetical protein